MVENSALAGMGVLLLPCMLAGTNLVVTGRRCLALQCSFEPKC